MEIANHAGTPDQDAFSGYLNSARISYSHKQPSLFTITVDGQSVQGHDQWHIPSFDERNQQKYLYKIHSIDAYLWTEKDAATLLGHLRNTMPADKLEIKDAPSRLQSPSEHRDSMSPVVQQLEKTAIGSHFPPRAESTASAQSFPGPPTPASAAATSPPPAQAAPMAYNPAAPAAPETVVYREKTPPPIDDGNGTGLSNAAKYDSMPQQQYANVPPSFQSSQQATPQQSYFPGPPPQQFPGPPQNVQQRSHSGSLPPPPPPPAGGPSPLHQQQGWNPSFASPPTSPPAGQANFNRQSSFSSGPPGPPQFASYQPGNPSQQPQHTPSFGPGALASPGLPGTPGHQPPTPGFSQYQYQPQAPGAGGYEGGMHGQAYTPSAAEMQANPKLAGQMQQWQQQQQAQQAQQQQVGVDGRQPGMTGRVEAYEKKVGGFLKRLDKKFGV